MPWLFLLLPKESCTLQTKTKQNGETSILALCSPKFPLFPRWGLLTSLSSHPGPHPHIPTLSGICRNISMLGTPARQFYSTFTLSKDF